MIRLDAATAVHLAARVRVLQLARRMIAMFLLVTQSVGQVVVERAVPGPLNQPAARRVVARDRDPGRGSLCLVKGGDPQPQQDRGALLRATGAGHSVQLDPPRGDPHADVGPDAG